MRRLRFGDKLMRVRDEPEPPPDPASSSTAPALVCIHGAGMSSVVWMDLVRRFAPARRVVAPDLPGHGQSDRWHEISIDGYRDAVGTVCATLKLSRAILVGHSMGAAVALSCALAWPERVAGLVLLNGAARLPVSESVMALLERSLPTGPLGEKERIDRMPDALAELSFSPSTPADLRARWQAVLLAAEREVVLDDFRACGRFDVREQLPGLATRRIPTLLVSGRDDLLVPTGAVAKTAALLPGSRHVVVEGSGHLSHLEQPAAFYTHLEEFLR